MKNKKEENTVFHILRIVRVVLFKVIMPTLIISFLLLLLSRFIMEGMEDYYNYFCLHPIVYFLRSKFSLDDITCYSLIYIPAFLLIFSVRQFYLANIDKEPNYNGRAILPKHVTDILAYGSVILAEIAYLIAYLTGFIQNEILDSMINGFNPLIGDILTRAQAYSVPFDKLCSYIFSFGGLIIVGVLLIALLVVLPSYCLRRLVGGIIYIFYEPFTNTNAMVYIAISFLPVLYGVCSFFICYPAVLGFIIGFIVVLLVLKTIISSDIIFFFRF